MTAVLADGSEIGSLAGLPKETVGLHWPSLLCGSEGTLAVVTAGRLRLVPWYRHTTTAMVATAGLDEAVAVLGALRAGMTHLDAVELILPDHSRVEGEVTDIRVSTVDGQADADLTIASSELVMGGAGGLISSGTPVTAILHLNEEGPLAGVDRADGLRAGAGRGKGPHAEAQPAKDDEEREERHGGPPLRLAPRCERRHPPVCRPAPG